MKLWNYTYLHFEAYCKKYNNIVFVFMVFQNVLGEDLHMRKTQEQMRVLERKQIMKVFTQL
jgi:hypothetical protein